MGSDETLPISDNMTVSFYFTHLLFSNFNFPFFFFSVPRTLLSTHMYLFAYSWEGA
jgi:hypothetical protein